jgi:hypothetical protein
MGGGLMQLVAYGAQDIYLTGNPQITFFKVVYRRHTNFSMEAIEQTINGTVAEGGRNTVTISRNGDLVGKIYWQLELAAEGVSAFNPGHLLIDSVEVEIGGQNIDKQYGHFMEAHAELTEVNSSCLVGTQGANTGTNFQNMSGAGGVVGADTAATLYVPLRFWFCRNPGLALPLIALQYHEVKIITVFGSTANLNMTGASCKLWCDYIYLDTDERRRFAQVSHEYLIEQVQYQNTTGINIDLNFNHPVKELIWTGAYSAATGSRTGLNTGNYKLKLNGHDRLAERPAQYFTQVQPYQHHTGVGLDSAPSAGAGNSEPNEIAVYSFALKPEEHQPSGTCNFSRIDNAQLNTPASAAYNVYAINYNVLRIMSGMGGLAYSN